MRSIDHSLGSSLQNRPRHFAQESAAHERAIDSVRREHVGRDPQAELDDGLCYEWPHSFRKIRKAQRVLRNHAGSARTVNAAACLARALTTAAPSEPLQADALWRRRR